MSSMPCSASSAVLPLALSECLYEQVVTLADLEAEAATAAAACSCAGPVVNCRRSPYELTRQLLAQGPSFPHAVLCWAWHRCNSALSAGVYRQQQASAAGSQPQLRSLCVQL